MPLRHRTLLLICLLRPKCPRLGPRGALSTSARHANRRRRKPLLHQHPLWWTRVRKYARGQPGNVSHDMYFTMSNLTVYLSRSSHGPVPSFDRTDTDRSGQRQSRTVWTTVTAQLASRLMIYWTTFFWNNYALFFTLDYITTSNDCYVLFFQYMSMLGPFGVVRLECRQKRLC